MSQESLASVSHLQERKTRAETYQSFHELYGAEELAKRGATILLNRVLYIDEMYDRSIHVVVAQRDIPGARILPMLPQRRGILVRYSHAEMLVATTNGETIDDYTVSSVHGVRASMNSRAYYEQLHLKFTPTRGGCEGSAEFMLGSGDGSFKFGANVVGRVLCREESDYYQQLASASDTPPFIQGTVAS